MAGLTINIDTNDKELFSSICNKMGMNVTTAITIFIKAVNRTRKIPFEITADEDFTEETLAAIQESRDIINGKKKFKGYSNVDDLFRDLLSADTETEYKP